MEQQKEINTLHSEHLNAGVSPIMACVGSYEDYPEKFADIKTGENIKWDANEEELEQKKLLNAGRQTYVISQLNSENKRTDGLLNCTGIVATGRDKETGEDISFLSHQYFWKLAHAEDGVNLPSFIIDLDSRLEELKERCIPGTVDVVIIGGRYGAGVKKDYKDAIQTLSETVKNVFDFEPVVITGPKTTSPLEEEDILYDTKNRRLYITRPEVGNATAESFLPDQYEEKEKNWKPGA